MRAAASSSASVRCRVRQGKGGVLVGGAALYISKQSAPDRQAAAWDLIKFLVSPQAQAEWAAGTGYVPIRKSAIERPEIIELWAKEPGYKVAYDQLVARGAERRDRRSGHRVRTRRCATSCSPPSSGCSPRDWRRMRRSSARHARRIGHCPNTTRGSEVDPPAATARDRRRAGARCRRVLARAAARTDGARRRTIDCPVAALPRPNGRSRSRSGTRRPAANLTELERQIAAFEATQDKVRVNLVDQTGYRESFEKYKAGLSSGDLPDLGQFEETTVQQLLDSESTVASRRMRRRRSLRHVRLLAAVHRLLHGRPACCARCRGRCRTRS